MRSVLVLVVLLSACPLEQEPPGEPVGTYDFVGTLTEHTCGTFAIPDETPLQLTAEIRTEPDGLAYWQTRGGNRIAGTLIADTYRFRSSQQLNVLNPEPSIGYPGCVLVRQDVIVLEERASAQEPSSDGGVDDSGDGGVIEANELVGTNRAEFSPIPGSDCTPALVLEGGIFQALPCRVEYELIGNLAEESNH